MLAFGLTVALTGVSIVFLALVFLIIVIKGITYAAKIMESPKTQAPAAIKAEQPAAPILEARVEAQNNQPDDEEEIIAVISAAIASLSRVPVAIKTIRRLPGERASVWSHAGRVETMSLRQL